MLKRRTEPGGNEQGTEFVAVQRDGVGFNSSSHRTNLGPSFPEPGARLRVSARISVTRSAA
jgi:hypothetical protein